MGLLTGTRVVELASERAAYAGKLLADMGAEVIVVEPPGGHETRRFGPFVDDACAIENSLWWWYFNTSKKSVVMDLPGDAALFERLVARADIVLDGESPGNLARIGVDDEALRDRHPHLVWVSVTPFGRSGPRAHEASIDLTVIAAGGPAWSCGYDDHEIAPVRPGGLQGYHTGCVWAVMGALSALLHRRSSTEGRGQLVDVNLHAASNVTTEAGSYQWLVRQETVQRQTGRHAATVQTAETVTLAADGRYVTTGVPPRCGAEFRALLGWMDDLGVRDEFDDVVFLEMAAEIDNLDIAKIGTDPVVTEMFAAGRAGTILVASRLSAYEFFVQGQRRGLTTAIVYSPEEVLSDPHFVARGFPVEVDVEHLGRRIVFPGAPFTTTVAEGYRVSRAPYLDEHADDVRALLDDGTS